MERKLIVTLLQKNIQELAMITEGFMEMTEYPAVIIQLARQKTEDVLDYIRMLEEIKNEKKTIEITVLPIVNQETIDVFAEEKAQKVERKIKEEAEKEAQRLLKDKEEEEERAKKIAEEEVKAEIAAEEARKLAESAKRIAEEEAKKKAELAEKITEEVKQERVHEQSKTVLGEQIAKQKSENDTTIADAHTQKKIDDINQAISMGNRFRFQRELFESNGELMNKTLSKLNQMSDFDEASEYLQAKFKWQNDNETVESFYQIVKRKFI